ncbi:hypothetical protein Nos7524_3246 [Nostoc sp. PCC 7524]|uniref:hypothetical protein n=1 Tax=Nostoc sp. (strain ATCC 29411 / PCC 7524) TaxID=28072 RepID=UPI00029F33BA|nr:hypothetical protein [Nostoc sp. PCC 7524]AFY49044.1 hypothetical protein Nos7524_3246 [Nostoc sp. PCC 7524]
MKKYHKLLITTTAIVRVSKLIAISLLCLVGCSAESSNQSNSDLQSSEVSSSPSFLGCWQGLSPDGNIKERHYFDANKEYKVTRRRDNPQPASGGGITIRDRDWHFKNYSGKWSSDGKSIQVQSDGLGTFLLEIVSGYQLKFVESSGNYGLYQGEQSPTSFLKCSE